MREIKIRFWDKKIRKMSIVCDLSDADSIGRLYFTIFGDRNHKPHPIQDMEIVQYTGFKDKNGKEIYEGDIVKEIYNTGESRNAEFIWSITWDELQGAFTDDEGELISDLAERIEVIGNIYENPELTFAPMQ